MASTQQAAPKTPKQPKEQVQKQVAQQQPQIPQEQPQVPQEQLQAAQNQEQQAQEQPQEQPQVPKEQLQAAQNQEQVAQEQQQTNDQLEVDQEKPQLTQEQIEAANQFIEAAKKTKESISASDRVKLVLDVIKEIKSKLQAEPTPVRIGIKDFHDNMMAESEQRAADALKAKEESDDSNVITRRK